MIVQKMMDVFPEAVKYVEWFHTKFRTTYIGKRFPTMHQDHAALITAIEMNGCRTVCEIGTWKGDTALMMALHPNIVRVKAIDIHKDMGVEIQEEMKPNHNLMAKEEYGVMFRNTFVELEFADTMKYPRGDQQWDMVFIDAAHDYDHVKNDTELALSWDPKVIVWHDFNIFNSGVVKFLNEVMEQGMECIIFPNSDCVMKILK